MNRLSIWLAAIGFIVLVPSAAYYVSFLFYSPIVTVRTQPDEVEFRNKGRVRYVTPTQIAKYHLSILGWCCGTALWFVSGLVNRRWKMRRKFSN